MAAPRNMTHGTLVIKDGTGTPETLTIPCREGVLSFAEISEAPVIKNRGVLYAFADPVQEAVDISFTLLFEEWQGKSASGSDPSPRDALKKEGNASGWTTTLTGGPYCVDLEFTIAKPSEPAATEENEVLTFSDFHADRCEFTEGEDVNRLVVTGKALITKPSVTRS